MDNRGKEEALGSRKTDQLKLDVSNASKDAEDVGTNARGRPRRSTTTNVVYRISSSEDESENEDQSDDSEYFGKPSLTPKRTKSMKRKKKRPLEDASYKVANKRKPIVHAESSSTQLSHLHSHDEKESFKETKKYVPFKITIKKVSPKNSLKVAGHQEKASGHQQRNIIDLNKGIGMERAALSLQDTGAYALEFENGKWVKKFKANASAAAGKAPDENAIDILTSERRNRTSHDHTFKVKIEAESSSEELDSSLNPERKEEQKTNQIKHSSTPKRQRNEKARDLIEELRKKQYAKICEICGEQTNSYEDTVAHNKLKHNIVYYICWAKQCNKKEFTHSDFLKHFYIHKHTDIPCPFSCSNWQFNNKYGLIHHLQGQHLSEMGRISTVPSSAQLVNAMKKEYVMEKLEKIGISKHYELLQNSNYICAFDEKIKMPRWVMEVLVPTETKYKDSKKKFIWSYDPRIGKDKQLTPPAIQSVAGCEVGHLAAAGNHNQTTDETYWLTNVMPMNSKVNVGPWKALEDHARKLVTSGWDQVTVITGPIVDKSIPGILVPGCYFMDKPSGMFKILFLENQLYASLLQVFVVPNEEVSQSIWTYRSDLTQIEAKTGISFLTNVNPIMSWSDEAMKMTIKCKECNKPFFTPESLRKHTSETHFNKFRCKKCPKSFDSVELLLAHFDDHHLNLICPFLGCNKTFNHPCRQTLHIDTHLKPLICKTCGKRFGKKGNLDIHMRIHENNKQYKCRICGYAAVQNGALRVHMRIHTGEKPYVCEYCGYSCTQGQQLKQHKRLHTGTKKYTCKHCDYTTFNLANLKKHRTIHTAERNKNVCEICGYTTSIKSNFKKHKQIHTSEKPYKCEICGRAFSVETYLIAHKIVHSDEKKFVCELCGRGFKFKSKLTDHIKSVHEKVKTVHEKKFVCEVCGYATHKKSTITEHLRIHTGEKPYVCEYCGYASAQSGSLMQHVRCHTVAEKSGKAMVQRKTKRTLH